MGKYLLFQKSNINGYTPFHEAASMGRIQILKFLWKIGAAFTTKTNNGETALDIARRELLFNKKYVGCCENEYAVITFLKDAAFLDRYTSSFMRDVVRDKLIIDFEDRYFDGYDDDDDDDDSSDNDDSSNSISDDYDSSDNDSSDD